MNRDTIDGESAGGVFLSQQHTSDSSKDAPITIRGKGSIDRYFSLLWGGVTTIDTVDSGSDGYSCIAIGPQSAWGSCFVLIPGESNYRKVSVRAPLFGQFKGQIQLKAVKSLPNIGGSLEILFYRGDPPSYISERALYEAMIVDNVISSPTESDSNQSALFNADFIIDGRSNVLISYANATGISQTLSYLFFTVIRDKNGISQSISVTSPTTDIVAAGTKSNRMFNRFQATQWGDIIGVRPYGQGTGIMAGGPGNILIVQAVDTT
jgi:hypothetical protein